jgi:hypothetical protein
MSTGFAPIDWLIALAALAVGLALGFLHFRSLRRAADAFARGEAGRALALQLVRLALLGLFLFAAARAGALALLAAALGIFIGRAVVMHRKESV